MSDLRIPFAEAVGEPLLLKKAFDTLSVPQRMALKACYAMPLTPEELRHWSAMNGQGVYDEFGYLVGLRADVPYVPQDYHDITLIWGRRSGKSSAVSSFIVAYEALCGGHHEFIGRTKKQVPRFIQIAQDLATAKANLRQFILDYLESSPIGKRELGDLGQSVTADEIRLKNALIVVGPPSIKIRSQAIAVAALDELAVWSKDTDAAMPDFEVQRAVTPAMAQFPHAKLVKTSTPMTKEGLLWAAHETGTQGRLVGMPAHHRGTLVLTTPTASSGNPVVTRAYLERERAKDPEAFSREFLAQFADSVSGFLSAQLLHAAVPKGLRQRPAKPDTLYVATMDPAFRRDTFALSIGHIEDGKFVLDLLEGWRGTRDVPISPAVVMTYIAGRLKEYGIRSIVSDQYHMESLQELAEQQDFALEPFPLTNQVKKQMWGEFALMLAQGKLALLDHPDFIDECAKLEKTLTASGATQISGTRDDYAMCVALNLHRALQFGERRPPQAVVKPTTHEEQFWAALRAKKPSEQPWYV